MRLCQNMYCWHKDKKRRGEIMVMKKHIENTTFIQSLINDRH